jgi:hypothetical protein
VRAIVCVRVRVRACMLGVVFCRLRYLCAC